MSIDELKLELEKSVKEYEKVLGNRAFASRKILYQTDIIQALSKLMQSLYAQEGFTRLVENQKIEHTFERVITRDKYKHLFDETTIKNAQRRLKTT